jgi:ribonuclease D
MSDMVDEGRLDTVDASDMPAEPEPAPAEPRDGVPEVITTYAALQAYANALAAGTGPLAVDAERASGYRYSQRAYLIQLRRDGAGSALIDPIAVTDLSAIAQATVGVEWILHAATQDLPCLAEVGLIPASLFDTELAGRLLGRERVNLGALVRSELGHVLEKGHGAADWSVRPLPANQLRYAVLDVEFLIELRDALQAALIEAGKWDWAEQEFTSLLDFRPRERGEDAWRKTSGIHAVRKARNLAVVRELWRERDRVATRSDIATGRILPDSAIVAAATALPKNVDELSALPPFSGRGQQRRRSTWWSAIERAYALPETDLPAVSVAPTGPPPPRAWADKNPSAFARLEAAKSIVSEISESRGLPAENIVNPELLRRLCWEPPAEITETGLAEALRASGARPWQAGLVAEALATAWSDMGSDSTV